MVSSCGIKTDDRPFTLTRIDADAVNRVRDHVTNGGQELRVNSTGGHSQSALKIAEFLTGKDITVVVTGQCSSSCAEYILPAASKIELVGNPIVAMHQNNQIRLHKSTSLSGLTQRERECLKVFSAWADDLLERTGSDTDHYLKTLDRLKIKGISVDRGNGDCPIINFDLEPDIWILTTDELRAFLRHDDIEGELCSKAGAECLSILDDFSATVRTAYINGSVVDLH